MVTDFVSTSFLYLAVLWNIFSNFVFLFLSPLPLTKLLEDPKGFLNPRTSRLFAGTSKLHCLRWVCLFIVLAYTLVRIICLCMFFFFPIYHLQSLTFRYFRSCLTRGSIVSHSVSLLFLTTFSSYSIEYDVVW